MDYQTLFKNLLNKRFSKAPRRVNVAVELENSAIMLAAFEDKPVDRIVKIHQSSFGSYVEAGTIIRTFISELGPTDSLRFIVSLPRHHALLRFLDLPSSDTQELRAMARLQAISALPFREEDVISDALVIGPAQTPGLSRIMLAILQKTIMMPYLELFESAGVYPDGFMLTDMGSAAYIRQASQQSLESALVVDIADRWLTLDVFEQDILSLSRCVPLSAENDIVESVLTECRRTLASTLTPAKHIYVMGRPPSYDRDFLKTLQAGLAVPISWVAYDPGSSSQVRISVIGAAQARREDAMQLLPVETQRRQFQRKRHLLIRRLGAWTVGWAVLALALLGGRILQKERYAGRLDVKIQGLAPQARAAVEATEKISRERGGADLRPLDVLRELAMRAPRSVTLRSISCESNGSCQFQGTAPALSDVVEFANRLQASPEFTRSELQNSNLRLVRGVEHVDFQIRAQIHGSFGGTRL